MQLDRTHIPLPAVNASVEELGYTTNSMVSAVGRDRAVNEPLNEHWRPVLCRPGPLVAEDSTRPH